ncbi:uncharacterized protein LOC110834189 isoform X2 [Zootermopsis nevadensis]|nr:uncharacterized protein LOC110834189 isoform X2 [Zootermopsis nevadensis]XP_021928777.1 uncharacterized protein LOC110834189 isoform X2 [Zootermopsis nevadensis]XP_021928778.1 uncharacterized protein LOC110834189 isoform X2 [Zootermopsis nevadensis]
MTDIIKPKWLDDSFLEIALRSGANGSSMTVTSSDVIRATVAGDNYASDIYRVTVRFTRDGQADTISLIVKSEPTKEELSKMLSTANIFEREINAFVSVMPAVHRILDDASPGTFQPYTAKCLYYHIGPPSTVIVLEDLKEQGFRMAQRRVGLDLDHCLLVVRAIARCHAASAVLNREDPEMMKPFVNGWYVESCRKELEPLFCGSIRNVAKQVEKWQDSYSHFASKLYKLADKAVDCLIKDSARKDGDFNVFIHGDLWLNNIMFRYSDITGEVEDIRFVDYQVCQFTDPAQDLQYFLFTSPSTNLLDKHSFLVEEYHKTLEDTLTLLGHGHLCPSLNQLHKQLDRKGCFAVITACSILPIILADPNSIPDIEKVLKDEASTHFSEEYKETIRKLLPIFERKGWLDPSLS